MDGSWEFEDGLFFDETGLVEESECVLVIVDVQEKLLAVMDGREAILQNALKLAKFARIAGLPVLVTEQEKLGPTVPALSAEIEGFEPVTKLDFDACQVPLFAKRLADLGRETVVVAGIESHICVAQTVLSLLPSYDVHVIADAVGSRAPANKQVALERMRFNGATISSTEMFIYEVLKRAGTEEFKQVLKLVK